MGGLKQSTMSKQTPKKLPRIDAFAEFPRSALSEDPRECQSNGITVVVTTKNGELTQLRHGVVCQYCWFNDALTSLGVYPQAQSVRTHIRTKHSGEATPSLSRASSSVSASAEPSSPAGLNSPFRALSLSPFGKSPNRQESVPIASHTPVQQPSPKAEPSQSTGTPAVSPIRGRPAQQSQKRQQIIATLQKQFGVCYSSKDAEYYEEDNELEELLRLVELTWAKPFYLSGCWSVTRPNFGKHYVDVQQLKTSDDPEAKTPSGQPLVITHSPHCELNRIIGMPDHAPCIRPSHLQRGSTTQNAQERVAKFMETVEFQNLYADFVDKVRSKLPKHTS